MSGTAGETGATRCPGVARVQATVRSAACLLACSSATTISCLRGCLSESKQISRSRTISMTVSFRLEPLHSVLLPKSSTSSRRCAVGLVMPSTIGFSTQRADSPGRKHGSSRTRSCERAQVGLSAQAPNLPSQLAGPHGWNISTTIWEKPAALSHRALVTNRQQLISTIFALGSIGSSTGRARRRMAAMSTLRGRSTPIAGMSTVSLPSSSRAILFSARPIRARTA